MTQLAIEPHHQAGARVLVLVGVNPARYLPGIVDAVAASDEGDAFDYRVDVRGHGIGDGRYWSRCAPSCVLPIPQEAA